MIDKTKMSNEELNWIIDFLVESNLKNKFNTAPPSTDALNFIKQHANILINNIEKH